MEVSGKKAKQRVKLCKPCQERNISTYAGGLCSQCSEHMCKACFDTHKQFKIFRGHRWVNADDAGSSGELTEDYDLCDKHSSEPIKFFCPHHDQVGCGDCMIIGHKSCKVEYIRDLLNAYQESKDYKQFKKEVEKNCNEATMTKTSIINNIDQIKDVNKKFKCDVIKFKDELISHITKMANALLKYGDDIMAKDLDTMDSLEKEHECLIGETSRINDTLRSLTDQPYKLFITSVKNKKKLHQIQDQLERFKGKDKFERYVFTRDRSIEQLLQEGQHLGKLQQNKETDKIDKKTTDTRQTHEKAMSVLQREYQPLIQRQKLCKNLNIDGQILSYAASAQNEVGIYVDNRSLKTGDLFEIEIVSIGSGGSIAIGIVPNDYPDNLLPGLGERSRGYHSDGRVRYWGGDCDGKEILWKRGDRIGCKIADDDRWNYFIVFTHNGREVDTLYGWRGGHFAVGMKSEGDKVKVII